MSSLLTDPNHESPDVIDQRPPDDPTHFDPRPGEPSVTPGILLPGVLPSGWTIGPDGSMTPLEPAPGALPVVNVQGPVPSSSVGLLVAGACAVVGFLIAWRLRG